MYMKKIFSEKFTNFIFIFLIVGSLTTNVIQAQKNYFKNHLNDKSILERKEFNKVINIIQETDLLKKNKLFLEEVSGEVQRSTRQSSVVAQDALGNNEDRHSSFVSHDPVIFVKGIVSTACCLKHFAQ